MKIQCETQSISVHACLCNSARRLAVQWVWHVCSAAKFNGVHALDIHFPDSLGSSELMEIYFIGIKGEFTEVSFSPHLNLNCSM